MSRLRCRLPACARCSTRTPAVVRTISELQSSLLHEVLRRRRGLPILLAVLWVEVGRRAGIAVYPVGMPGHFLVGVGDPDGDHVLVDAYRGGDVVSLSEAERLAVDSAGIALTPSHLRPTEPVDVLMRLLTNIRVYAAGLAASLDNVTTRLWAVELSLLLPRHPVDLRRERAELLVRVGGFVEAAAGVRALCLRGGGGQPRRGCGGPVGGQGLARPLQLRPRADAELRGRPPSPRRRVGSMLRLTDTRTRQVEEIVPARPGELRMYTCGPTVYRYSPRRQHAVLAAVGPDPPGRRAARAAGHRRAEHHRRRPPRRRRRDRPRGRGQGARPGQGRGQDGARDRPVLRGRLPPGPVRRSTSDRPTTSPRASESHRADDRDDRPAHRLRPRLRRRRRLGLLRRAQLPLVRGDQRQPARRPAPWASRRPGKRW